MISKWWVSRHKALLNAQRAYYATACDLIMCNSLLFSWQLSQHSFLWIMFITRKGSLKINRLVFIYSLRSPTQAVAKEDIWLKVLCKFCLPAFFKIRNLIGDLYCKTDQAVPVCNILSREEKPFVCFSEPFSASQHSLGWPSSIVIKITCSSKSTGKNKSDCQYSVLWDSIGVESPESFCLLIFLKCS